LPVFIIAIAGFPAVGPLLNAFEETDFVALSVGRLIIRIVAWLAVIAFVIEYFAIWTVAIGGADALRPAVGNGSGADWANRAGHVMYSRRCGPETQTADAPAAVDIAAAQSGRRG
jgi:hypothetical protein